MLTSLKFLFLFQLENLILKFLFLFQLENLILKFINENPNITTEIVYDFPIPIPTDILKGVDYQ